MLQRLRPKQVKDWHNTLSKLGARAGDRCRRARLGMHNRSLQTAVETEVLGGT